MQKAINVIGINTTQTQFQKALSYSSLLVFSLPFVRGLFHRGGFPHFMSILYGHVLMAVCLW